MAGVWPRRVFWIGYVLPVVFGILLLFFEKGREQIGRLILPDQDLGRRALAVLAAESQPLGSVVIVIATTGLGFLLWELAVSSKRWEMPEEATEPEEPAEPD